MIVTYLQHTWARCTWGRTTNGFWQGCQTRSFFSNRGSKWPPVVAYNGSVTFKQLENRSAQFVKAGSIKWDNWYFFHSLEATMYGSKKWLQTSRKSMLLLREREINPHKKIRDPAGIRTQGLLNTSQTLLPLGHLDPWQRSGRQAT